MQNKKDSRISLGRSGNSPSLIPALWNIGILLHKQATRNKHFETECKYVNMYMYYIFFFSRSKRKQENKKYSTKEGSKYEDLGLMAALSDLISQTYKSTFNEVSSLLRVLVKYGFKDTAKKIQDKTMKLDAEIKEKESVIWNPKWMDTLVHEDQNVKFGPGATTEEIVNKTNDQDSVYKPELSMLEPKFRFPPQRLPNNDWMLQILM